MNTIVGVSYQMLGQYFERKPDEMNVLQLKLQQAHIGIRAAAFSATLGLAALVTFSWVGLVLASVLLLADVHIAFALIIPPLLGGLLGAGIYAAGHGYIELTIREKGADIDENLPQALNYMLALANAGLPPKSIWASLAKQPVFGFVQFEAERIHRDLDLFGLDLLQALRVAQERTASKRFAEFLQGAISAFRSGVELGTYLKTKSSQYQFEQEQVQKENVDTIGVLAESFLVAVVAAPLFLIILLTVMSISEGERIIMYGLVLVLGYIPMAQAGIGLLIRSMNPRIW